MKRSFVVPFRFHNELINVECNRVLFEFYFKACDLFIVLHNY